MLFTTDKQTLDDLNIFGKHGSDSVYGLFNHCSTRGGAMVLEELFKHPLSNEELINQRSGIIDYFSSNEVRFPFSTANFDAAERYLANTDERSRLEVQEYSTWKKISHLVAKEGEILTIEKGISAIIELLNQFKGFITSLTIPDQHPYRSEKQAIIDLLARAEFARVFQIGTAGELTNALMAEFDNMFRFKCREVIQNMLKYSYELDVYLSVAKVSRENGFVSARALPCGELSATLDEVYHPLVKNATATSLKIEPSGNILFLTGANMAGKSTFMKSLSIAFFLAHMGFPVAATKMEFTVLDGIFTTINLPDNLAIGASHFYAEVLRVKKIALELQKSKNLFILFDELFRGTNVKDAYDATIAIVQSFSKKQNSLFVISTHIIEAGEVLKKTCSNVRFSYLPTRMEGNKPIYTYQLEDGITNDRHGMIIINNEGILDILKAGRHKSIGKETETQLISKME